MQSDTQLEARAHEQDAHTLELRGDHPGAIRLMEKALLLRTPQSHGSSGFGAEHPERVLAAERLVVKYNTVAVRSFKNNDFDTAMTYLNNALRLTEAGQTHFEHAADERLRLRGTTFNNLGCLERRRGRLEMALNYLQLSIDHSGNQSPSTFLNMSAILSQLGRMTEAAGCARRAIGLLEANPVEHAGTLPIAYHNLAMSLESLDVDAAAEAYWQAFELAKRELGANSSTTQAIEKNMNRFAHASRRVLGVGSTSGGKRSTAADVSLPSLPPPRGQQSRPSHRTSSTLDEAAGPPQPPHHHPRGYTSSAVPVLPPTRQTSNGNMKAAGGAPPSPLSLGGGGSGATPQLRSGGGATASHGVKSTPPGTPKGRRNIAAAAQPQPPTTKPRPEQKARRPSQIETSSAALSRVGPSKPSSSAAQGGSPAAAVTTPITSSSTSSSAPATAQQTGRRTSGGTPLTTQPTATPRPPATQKPTATSSSAPGAVRPPPVRSVHSLPTTPQEEPLQLPPASSSSTTYPTAVTTSSPAAAATGTAAPPTTMGADRGRAKGSSPVEAQAPPPPHSAADQLRQMAAQVQPPSPVEKAITPTAPQKPAPTTSSSARGGSGARRTPAAGGGRAAGIAGADPRTALVDATQMALPPPGMGEDGTHVTYFVTKLTALIAAEELFEQRYSAAVKIQCLARRMLAHKALSSRRQRRANESVSQQRREGRAASIVTKFFRLIILKRAKMAEERQQEQGVKDERYASAVKIQSVARRWLAKNKVRRLRIYYRDYNKSLRILQCWFRKKLAEKMFRNMKKQYTAGSAQLLLAEKRHRSASDIQRVFRAYFAMQGTNKMRKTARAANERERQTGRVYGSKRIQCTWRGYQGRKVATAMRETRERRIALQEFHETRRQAVTTLQRVVRGFLSRRTSTVVKTRVLGHRADLDLDKRNGAAVKIQSLSRRMLARLLFQRKKIDDAAATRNRRLSYSALVIQHFALGAYGSFIVERRQKQHVSWLIGCLAAKRHEAAEQDAAIKADEERRQREKAAAPTPAAAQGVDPLHLQAAGSAGAPCAGVGHPRAATSEPSGRGSCPTGPSHCRQGGGGGSRRDLTFT